MTVDVCFSSCCCCFCCCCLWYCSVVLQSALLSDRCRNSSLASCCCRVELMPATCVNLDLSGLLVLPPPDNVDDEAAPGGHRDLLPGAVGCECTDNIASAMPGYCYCCWAKHELSFSVTAFLLCTGNLQVICQGLLRGACTSDCGFCDSLVHLYVDISMNCRQEERRDVRDHVVSVESLLWSGEWHVNSCNTSQSNKHSRRFDVCI